METLLFSVIYIFVSSIDSVRICMIKLGEPAKVGGVVGLGGIGSGAVS